MNHFTRVILDYAPIVVGLGVGVGLLEGGVAKDISDALGMQEMGAMGIGTLVLGTPAVVGVGVRCAIRRLTGYDSRAGLGLEDLRYTSTPGSENENIEE